MLYDILKKLIQIFVPKCLRFHWLNGGCYLVQHNQAHAIYTGISLLMPLKLDLQKKQIGYLEAAGSSVLDTILGVILNTF